MNLCSIKFDISGDTLTGYSGKMICSCGFISETTPLCASHEDVKILLNGFTSHSVTTISKEILSVVSIDSLTHEDFVAIHHLSSEYYRERKIDVDIRNVFRNDCFNKIIVGSINDKGGYEIYSISSLIWLFPNTKVLEVIDKMFNYLSTKEEGKKRFCVFPDAFSILVGYEDEPSHLVDKFRYMNLEHLKCHHVLGTEQRPYTPKMYFI